MAAGDLCSVSDIHQLAELVSGDTTRDAEIQTLITAASAVISRFVDRELTPPAGNPVTRRFYLETYDVGYRVEFAPYDLQSATTVTLNPEQSTPLTLNAAGASPDYVAEPLTPKYGVYSRLHVSPFLPIYSSFALRLGHPLVEVTGTWGFPTVPQEAFIACVQTVRAWLDRAVNQTAISDMGDMPRGYLPSPDSAYGLPLSAIRLLQGVKRWVV